MNKIEIPLSKTKLLLVTGASILFIVLGYFLFATIADQQTERSPTFVKGVGIAGILIFGVIGIYGVKKLFDKTIGLTIDENGIFDNTNALSVGLIRWTDIIRIEAAQVSSSKFLLIHVKNPEKYIENTKGVKRILMGDNNRTHGTPLTITSNTLKCKFSDLEKLINDKFKEYQESEPTLNQQL